MLRSSIRTSQRATNFAKTLRKNQTTPERILWEKLRKRRFHNLKFRRQAPLGPYIVDFLCVDRKLVIEVDGGSHEQPGAKEYDKKRDHYLKMHDFRLLRFRNETVRQFPDSVLHSIGASLSLYKEKGNARSQDGNQSSSDNIPSPSSPPSGRGSTSI